MTNKPQKELILASSSPRRKYLLENSGFTIENIISPDIDETPLKKELPHILAKRLAMGKNSAACEMLGDNKEQVVLSADTVVACGRRILPKATNAEEAELCLNMLSGKRHRVYTAICLSGYRDNKSDRQQICKVVDSHVNFRLLNKWEIEQYINSNEWQGKAGGYSIQGRAECFIKSINGSVSNIIGLPMFTTYNSLLSFNIYPKI